MAKSAQIIELMRKKYSSSRCALNYKKPYELLIATILSAQCTDERVNQVTKKLFSKYKSLESLSKTPLKELEKDIYSTGFYKNKAKNIKKCCQKIIKNFNSKLPSNMKDLTSLRGVGRKTANVVLGEIFKIPSGIVVDTHVTRISNRLSWVKTKNPDLIEKKLKKIIHKKDWISFSHWMISHGRKICDAKKPRCSYCFLKKKSLCSGVSK